MVDLDDALAPSLLLLFYAYIIIFIRPGRSVRAQHNTTNFDPNIWQREVEMHVCILRREFNIYRLLPHAGTSATQQTYKHEFMTHTFLYLISQYLLCINDYLS